MLLLLIDVQRREGKDEKGSKKGGKRRGERNSGETATESGSQRCRNALLGGTERVVVAPSLHRVAVPALHVAAVERRPCQLGGRRTVR